MLRSLTTSIVFLAVFAPLAPSALAKAPEPPVVAPSDCVEITVCVPTWVTELRTVKETHYRQEQRERKVTVYQPTQVKTQLESKCTKFYRVTKTDTQVLKIAKPVVKWVVQEYTVQVPHQEIRKGTRKVCRLVPGTCDQYETVEEPYECTVTVCKPEIRTCKTRVWETVHEEQTKTHTYCTVEPRVTVTPYEVTECRWLPVEKTQTYTACVPYEVEKQVEVRVCKLVPKTVRVPRCCP
jgi:hypothetical protein